MEKYYSILGIPNNSSKEVVKKAYHEKIKALHPDKIHGTALEDTAAFFTSEINVAYNSIMNRYNEQQQFDFIEEEIYIEGHGNLIYTLSNDINVIINEITNRTGCIFREYPQKMPWNINYGLSANVKNSMNANNYDYSMTIFPEGDVINIIINKRENSNWFYCGFHVETKNETAASNHKTCNGSNKINSLFSKIVKIIIAVIVFGFIFNHFNTMPKLPNPSKVNYSKNAQVYGSVASCDWLNVRSSPSSVNDRNIIEAIRADTRVEITERTGNGWVRVRYGNGKSGYVHSNYLSF